VFGFWFIVVFAVVAYTLLFWQEDGFLGVLKGFGGTVLLLAVVALGAMLLTKASGF
jgi:hypothetical protein